VFFAALAAALLLVSFLGFFFFRDNLSTHYPIKVVSAQVFRAGEIPYWNFADGGGQPLAGNPNTLTFYPDNVLYLLLPAHAAFNLHFLLHLVAAWFAMRALSRSKWAAWMYVLSGVAISSTAFYNLVTAIALVPFALWAAERRRPLLLGCAFGLLLLGSEPVTIIGAAIAVAIVARTPRLLLAVPVALLIALPQVIAYSEIATEVERARGYSPQTVLAASLLPHRFLQLLLPQPEYGQLLFFSLFLGVIIVPALAQRSRYVVVAAVMAFLALGSANPLVAAAVQALPAIRIVRYPEKFALPMTVALVVLSASLLEKRKVWRLVTLGPLAIVAVLTVPIDWFGPYRIAPVAPHREWRPSGRGDVPSRQAYRQLARDLQPIFGAVAGVEYVLNRSPDGMHSLASRIVAERFAATHHPAWLRIATTIVPRATGVRSIDEAVRVVEGGGHAAPMSLNGFASAPEARIVRQRRLPQAIELEVIGPALVLTDQTFFRSWSAGWLQTVPIDIDRLGIIVPAGRHEITLRFGRHRTAVVAAWLVSSLLLLAGAFALRIEKLDGRAGEVERPADEDAARG